MLGHRGARREGRGYAGPRMRRDGARKRRRDRPGPGRRPRPPESERPSVASGGSRPLLRAREEAMESRMDFQAAAASAPGLGSDEAPEPPAMDTEEGPAARPGAPELRRGVRQSQEPPFAPPRPGCGPEARRRGAGPSPGPAAASDGGRGRAALYQGSGRELEEAAAAPQGSVGWEPGAGNTPEGVGHPRISSRGNPVGMELDETPEASARPGRAEWAKGAEADPAEMQGLLAQLETLDPNLSDHSPPSEQGLLPSPGAGPAPPAGEQPRRGDSECQGKCRPCPLHVAMGRGLATRPCCAQHSACSRPCHGLLFAEADREDLLSLLCYEGGLPEAGTETPLARSDILAGTNLEMLQAQEEPAAVEKPEGLERPESSEEGTSGSWYYGEVHCEVDSACEGNQDSSPEPAWVALPPTLALEPEQPPQGSMTNRKSQSSCSTFKEVPGPCDPEDLLDGVIFGAKYLGSTQLVSERNPPTSVRMAQAQEAVDRIKAPEGESQPMTEVDLFVSTQRIKVLTADTQEAMMDHSLQTISYIADIGSLVVLMARRKLPRRSDVAEEKRLYKMICHVFHSADAQIIAQAIGQAFGVAYQRFLEANSIDPSELSPRQYSRALEDQEQYNAELTHFSRQENCKDVCIRKQKGEILGIAIVESGWGSILPTVVIANLMHGGPAEKSGELSIGDRLMSVNGMSLVGLPLTTCQSIIRELKHQTEVVLNIVHCPPVTTAVIRRPDSKYQLGFCVENGVICSLMRGGIAERGGIRVGHRIIEINGQSVVATPHEKIIQILTQAVSEVHIKTMPASTYRLLTGQEQPLFL
ncbi:amyloid-beta A4 precursor protein-binding family A member 3 [Falco cherrug]|uniref:amyloid-beta A4 precursor protein-binding family A member 3 n=1 Tax=Falco cherrug TaxID=345164 RepID=UPI002478519B|nr:amyloid-beta A4 precursor protein-binding family A member 3 [Falco cherrug]